MIAQTELCQRLPEDLSGGHSHIGDKLEDGEGHILLRPFQSHHNQHTWGLVQTNLVSIMPELPFLRYSDLSQNTK